MRRPVTMSIGMARHGRHRRTTHQFATFLALALVVAACGRGGSGKTASPTTTASTESATPTTAATTGDAAAAATTSPSTATAAPIATTAKRSAGTTIKR